MGKNSKGSSVDLLAKAMKQVFKEAVELGVEPLQEEVHGLGGRMGKLEKKVDDLDGRVGTLQGNMQDQFNAQPKLISQEVHKIIERKSGK